MLRSTRVLGYLVIQALRLWALDDIFRMTKATEVLRFVGDSAVAYIMGYAPLHQFVAGYNSTYFENEWDGILRNQEPSIKTFSGDSTGSRLIKMDSRFWGKRKLRIQASLHRKNWSGISSEACGAQQKKAEDLPSVGIPFLGDNLSFSVICIPF